MVSILQTGMWTRFKVVGGLAFAYEVCCLFGYLVFSLLFSKHSSFEVHEVKISFGLEPCYYVYQPYLLAFTSSTRGRTAEWTRHSLFAALFTDHTQLKTRVLKPSITCSRQLVKPSQQYLFLFQAHNSFNVLLR